MRGDEILRLAREAVGDIGRRYGKPEQSFEKIATLWNAWLKIRKGGDLTGLDVALMMLLFKVGRIVGNGKHVDSFVDVCGHGACAGELASGGDVDNEA